MRDFQRHSPMKHSARRIARDVSFAALLVMGTTAQAAAGLEEQVLAGPCANCHGPQGRSPGAIPSIAGLPESVLKARFVAYKSDAPPAGTTIMNRLARGYTDDQIAALARYFAQINSPSTATPGAKP